MNGAATGITGLVCWDLQDPSVRQPPGLFYSYVYLLSRTILQGTHSAQWDYDGFNLQRRRRNEQGSQQAEVS